MKRGLMNGKALIGGVVAGYHQSRLSIGVVVTVMCAASSVVLVGAIQRNAVVLAGLGALGAYWFDDLVDLVRDEAHRPGLRRVRGLRFAWLIGGLAVVAASALRLLPQQPVRLRLLAMVLAAVTAVYCLRHIHRKRRRSTVTGEVVKALGWSAGCVLWPQLAAGVRTTPQTWMAFGFFFVLMLPVIDLWRFTSPRQPWRFRVLVVECCVAGLLAAIGVAFEWFPWFNLALLAAVAVNLLFIWMRQRALIRNKAVFTELTVGFNMLCGLLLIGAYRSGLRPQDAGPRSVGDYFMLFALVVLGAIVGGNLWLQRSHKHDVVRSEASTTAVLTLGFVVLGFQMLQASLHLQSWLLPWVNTRFFDVALLRWIGEAVMVAALLLLAWSYRKMGGSWRIGIDTETPGALVVSGAFGWSRNPIYLAVDLFMVGYFLLNPTLSGVLFVLSTPIFLHAQILREEAFLADAYGAEYAEYAAKSPRYL